MIFFDGIIESLQKNGGVSVVFKELIKNLPQDLRFKYSTFGIESSKLSSHNFECLPYRFLERYRRCPVSSDDISAFHSTYYRLPNKKVPVITTVHDFTYEYYSEGVKKFVHCQQKHNAIKNSDIVICVSENTALDLMKFCPIHEDKVRVVHNGVSESYHIQPNVNKRNSALFVGSRTSYKNFDLAVKAVSMVDSMCLDIVGGGDLTQHELGLLDSYLPQRYTKHSFISDLELNTLYNEVLALIYPSDYEGFGIPLLESMRAGCPVICGNSSSIPEVVGSSGIVLESVSAHSIGEALRSIQNNSSLRQSLISNGLEQSSIFSWKNTALQTDKIYQIFK